MPRQAAEKRDPSSVSNEERLAAMREATAAKRVVDEAQGAYRALLKRFKAEGLDTKAIIDTNAASRQDPAIVAAHEVERLRMMALRSIVTLDDVLSAADHLNVSAKARAEDNVAGAEESGYAAGKHGVPAEDCPYPSGSEFAAIWSKWHANGQRAAGVELKAGGGGVQADASRKRPVRKGAAKLSLVGGKGGKGGKGGGKKGRAGYLTSAEIEDIADEQRPN